MEDSFKLGATSFGPHFYEANELRMGQSDHCGG